MIMKEVHLVHVENPAVSRGEQSWLVDHLANAQSLPQIERADHAIFGSSHWKLDQPGGPSARHRMIMGTVRARRIEVERITAEAAALDYTDAGQYAGQSAHHGRFGCALLATYQYAAHLRGNGG